MKQEKWFLLLNQENIKYKPIFYSAIKTISRMISFEPISFLFNKNQYMWHKTLSKTKTVKKSREQRTELKNKAVIH
jgi:hypothetical protein